MELVRINEWFKETIKPMTDLEHWGVVEHQAAQVDPRSHPCRWSPCSQAGRARRCS